MDEQKAATPEDLHSLLCDSKDDLRQRVTALEAENAALKSTIASLLSIDDSKVAEYVVLSPEALQAAAANRVAELEAQVARLEAPVSNEEWARQADCGDEGESFMQRWRVDRLIAARITPPAKETE